MSKRARTRPVKIRTLQARMDFLATLVEDLEPGDKRRPWMRAEIGALEWAIPILEAHIAGHDVGELKRRPLDKHSTVEDVEEEDNGLGITEPQKIR